MSLIWQVTKPSDLFCLEEIESLEVRGERAGRNFFPCGFSAKDIKN